MPVDAKFCGFCGASLKTLEDKKVLPIWELFEPGAFIIYLILALMANWFVITV
jgi:hypothetical protein